MDSAIRQLELQFQKAQNDLHFVEQSLESEFAETGYDSVQETTNPLKIIKELRSLREQIPELKQECEQVISSKRNIVQNTQEILLQTNRNKLTQIDRMAHSGNDYKKLQQNSEARQRHETEELFDDIRKQVEVQFNRTEQEMLN
eukprot:gb/GECH01003164.1/.p1 GENE.gb/GECH01003164.1/~~gb/GECH01003164.1/.p1  ORF type:complete len:144 (+),score=49.19 gb/GECH01003164.1/:1-432(+)